MLRAPISWIWISHREPEPPLLKETERVVGGIFQGETYGEATPVSTSETTMMPTGLLRNEENEEGELDFFSRD